MTLSLIYDKGTVRIDGDVRVPYSSWDPRVRAYRAMALYYKDIVDYLEHSDVEYVDRVMDLIPCPQLTCELGLWDYQAKALDAWLRADKRGTIVLPTGAGKTVIAMKAISSLNTPTIVVVPTLDLVEQWRRRLASEFGVEVGVYGGGQRTLEALTVSTYDSAYLLTERLGNRFEFVVFDECLPHDTLIATEFGWMKIGNFVKRFEGGERIRVMSFNSTKQSYLYPSEVHVTPPKRVLELETESGRKLRCSYDHLLLTPNGYVPADEARRVGLSSVAPYAMDKRLIECRILGHLFGDGYLAVNGSAGFSGDPRDLEKIKHELSLLGLSSSKISSRETRSEVKTRRGERARILGSSNELHASRKAFGYFMKIGAPVGEKATVSFGIPRRVLEASQREKAEFLASLMGSNGDKLQPRRDSSSFCAVRLRLYKLEALRQNALQYAAQLKSLFEDLGILISQIKVDPGNVCKAGGETIKVTLTIANSTRNLMRFLERVGYRYNREKETTASQILTYLKIKCKVLKERAKPYREVMKLRKKGLGRIKIAKKLGLPPYLVCEWLHRCASFGLPHERIKFDEWRRLSTDDEIIYEDLIGKVEVGEEPLFDLTVPTTHNYVAEGYIVHNCHHLPSPGYSQIAEMFASPCRMGLTATYEREDGLHEKLPRLVGGKVYELSPSALAGRYLAPYTVERVYVDLTPEEEAEYQKWHAVFKNYLEKRGIVIRRPKDFRYLVLQSGRDPGAREALLARNKALRIALSSSSKVEALREILAGKLEERVLVFTQHNELVHRISREFLIPFITHKTPKDERVDILNGFRSGRYRAVVTSKVLDEGIDIPDATVAVILSGTGSAREFVQRLGRVLRKREGKIARLVEIVSRGTVETGISRRRRRPRAVK